MSRKCKTPAKVKELLEKQQEKIHWLCECIRAKLLIPKEDQISFIQENSVESMVGMARGINMMVENILETHNCYAGFQYQASRTVTLDDGTIYRPFVGPKDADYAEWRVIYLTIN